LSADSVRLDQDASSSPLVEELASPDHIVLLRGVTKLYVEHAAVDNVDLEIRRGEFFTILGPSGSGKTTILRMIAGLIEPTAGQIFIDDKDVVGRKPYERDISMVFQSLALFPHMDVFSNIAFPLRMRRIGREEIGRRVRQALEVVRLPQIEKRPVRELSGGQRQRVALARALVYQPKLLLLDEPLGALDRRLREDMQLELVRLHQEIDVTIMNVTHDQREALMLSDRMAVMSDGRIEQVGGSEDLYSAPRSTFVASFIGDAVLADGEVEHRPDGARLRLGQATVKIPATTAGRATLVLRSESLHVASSERALPDCDNRFPGAVEVAIFEGTGTYYEVSVPELGQTLKASMPKKARQERLQRGADVWIGWRTDDVPLVEL
jgi:putative spermidine/putrescine transport system ATP-binding protein